MYIIDIYINTTDIRDIRGFLINTRFFHFLLLSISFNAFNNLLYLFYFIQTLRFDNCIIFNSIDNISRRQ